MKPVRIGIIGCGPIAQAAHLPATVKAQGAELYAICDFSAQLRDHAYAVHRPQQRYGSAADLLADPQVEAVIIGVADQFHVPLALDALAAGKHVLVEKPLSVDVESCRLLEHAAAAQQLVVQVGHNKRFDPGIEYAADMRPQLGPGLAYRGWYCDSAYRYTVTDNLHPHIVQASDAHRPPNNPKGNRRQYLLLTHGSHLVDTAIYLCGQITRVQTQLIHRDDSWCWFSAVTFADGSVGHLDLTVTLKGDHHEGFQVYARDGSIQAKTYLPWFFKSSDVDVFTHHDQQYHRPLGADGHSYKRQIEGFVQTIRGTTPQRGTSVAEARHILQVLAAMSASAQHDGSWVTVVNQGGAP